MRSFYLQMLGIGLCALLPLAEEWAFAQDAPALRLAKLVNDLDSDSFARRRQAEAALIAANAHADRLLAAALDHDSLEIRSRAESILRRRKINAVWEPTSHEYPGGNVPLSEVTSHFATTLGPAVVFEWPYEKGCQVSIKSGNVSALEALASAADQLGYRIYSTKTQGIRDEWPRVRFADCRNYVGRAFAGPLLLEIVSAKQDRRTNQLQLNLQLLWEPDFPLVSYSGEPASYEFQWHATDGRTESRQIPIDWHLVNDWYAQYPNLKPVRVTASLTLDRPIQRIDKLTMTWPMCAAATVGSVTVGHADPGRVIPTEAGEITILSPTQFAADNMRSWPEPAAAIVQSYRAKRLGRHDMVFQSGTMTKTGASWNLRSLVGESAGDLEIDYRTDFSRKDMEFVFEGIPVVRSGE